MILGMLCVVIYGDFSLLILVLTPSSTPCTDYLSNTGIREHIILIVSRYNIYYYNVVTGEYKKRSDSINSNINYDLLSDKFVKTNICIQFLYDVFYMVINICVGIYVLFDMHSSNIFLAHCYTIHIN